MTIIDKETWPHRAHYDFFTPMSDPFYTLTLLVDVTPLRTWCRGRSLLFYPAMMFVVTKAIKAVDAFYYKDRGGVIVHRDTLMPSLTDLKPGSKLFQIVTVEAGGGPADFYRRAGTQAAVQTGFITSDPWDEDQLVYFICLSWFPLTALKNKKDMSPPDSVLRATQDRWEEKESRTHLLLSLRLNHRLLDRIHIGRFYEALNR